MSCHVLSIICYIKIHIWYVQDTHFKESQEINSRTRWDGNCYFRPSVQANARVVAISFTKNNDYKIFKYKKDTEGNYLILDISIINKRLTLARVYRPNKDDPKLHIDLVRNIQSFENDSYIIRRYINLVLDPDLDYYKLQTHK